MDIKYLNLPIEAQVIDDFKKACAKYGLKQGLVAQALFEDYIKGKYDIIISKGKLSLRRNED